MTRKEDSVPASSYRKRLARDLPRWQERGWVTAEGAAAILDSVNERPAASLSAVVAVLGAVLFGLGVIGLGLALPARYRLGWRPQAKA